MWTFVWLKQVLISSSPSIETKTLHYITNISIFRYRRYCSAGNTFFSGWVPCAERKGTTMVSKFSLKPPARSVWIRAGESVWIYRVEKGRAPKPTKPQPEAVKAFYSTQMEVSQTLPSTPAGWERERVCGWMCVRWHTHLTTSWPCIAGGSHSRLEGTIHELNIMQSRSSEMQDIPSPPP